MPGLVIRPESKRCRRPFCRSRAFGTTLLERCLRSWIGQADMGYHRSCTRGAGTHETFGLSQRGLAEVSIMTSIHSPGFAIDSARTDSHESENRPSLRRYPSSRFYHMITFCDFDIPCVRWSQRYVGHSDIHGNTVIGHRGQGN